MTTIAASLKFKEIAADSRCSADGYCFNVTKLRIGPSSAYGAAGEWNQILKFYQSLEKGGEVESEPDVSILEYRTDGLWLYDGCPIPFKLEEEFYAIGTGAAYAMAAMHLGKSPKEAVEIASLFDPGTGGPIEVINMESRRGKENQRRRVNKAL